MATIELRGRVTGGPGTDQEGLTVKLYTAANWDSGSAATSSTTTDSDGRWNFDAVAAGTWIVVVENDDASVKILFSGRNEVQFTNVDVQGIINAFRVIPSTAFLHYQNSTDSDKTGNGATHTVDFETEVFDIGGDYAGTTFTARITGRYLLSVSVYVSGITGAADSLQLSPITSNRTFEHLIDSVNNLPIIKTMVWSMTVDMDANDTVTFTIVGTGEASDVWDIIGGAAPQTCVSGVLVA